MSENITICNNINELEIIVNFINFFGTKYTIPTKIIDTFQIAVDELISNTINYGYKSGTKGEIILELVFHNSTLKATIIDDGQAFDPNNAPVPDIENNDVENKRIGGLGIHIVKKMMTSFEYVRKKNKNIVTIIKKF